VPSFKDQHGFSGFCIAPTAIIKGLFMTVDLDIINVPGATGDVSSNHANKFKYALDHIQDSKYNFGFVHIKAIDDLGHDKDLPHRISLIEKLDKEIGELIVSLQSAYPALTFVITGDHTTHIHSGDHSFEPVPLAICDISSMHSPLLSDSVTSFDEISCAEGGLGRFPGSEVMKLIRRFSDKIESLKH
jgi:2,3-diphosphopglycerate-independent phosphoglycerate mutase